MTRLTQTCYIVIEHGKPQRLPAQFDQERANYPHNWGCGENDAVEPAYFFMQILQSDRWQWLCCPESVLDVVVRDPQVCWGRVLIFELGGDGVESGYGGGRGSSGNGGWRGWTVS